MRQLWLLRNPDHGLTYARKEVGFRQIFVTISGVWPNMCEKSCQKFVAIRVTSCSTLLSFCQIFLTITIGRFSIKFGADCHEYLAITQRDALSAPKEGFS